MTPNPKPGMKLTEARKLPIEQESFRLPPSTRTVSFSLLSLAAAMFGFDPGLQLPRPKRSRHSRPEARSMGRFLGIGPAPANAFRRSVDAWAENNREFNRNSRVPAHRKLTTSVSKLRRPMAQAYRRQRAEQQAASAASAPSAPSAFDPSSSSSVTGGGA